ncbi:hypothetical protein DE146DRAFT_774389 [Phaeosphaeria sp. MPI-PUGE-AT-0046c]|nr:hypothetical protein DE146DRAFT_774389 [Phaeosphaeria sp. MPI-PUGE-AT-0046c]
MRSSCFITISLLLPSAFSCLPPPQNNSSLPYNQTVGDDCPADPATASYFINHASVTVSNMTATKEWYSKVLGMRHIFTLNMSENYTIMYMGHAQGGRSGRGFQSGPELAWDKNNLAGLIEFVEYRGTHRRYVPGPSNTFSHFGLIVDDLAASQKRFERLAVNIVKRAGELDFSAESGSLVVAAAWAFDDLESEETQTAIKGVLPALAAIGFGGFCIIADPDGNLFEVQQLVAGAL